jgi:hypothetical protein
MKELLGLTSGCSSANETEDKQPASKTGHEHGGLKPRKHHQQAKQDMNIVDLWYLKI